MGKKEIKVKEKAGGLTITYKLTKHEQINSMELDIVQKGEIPTLLPIRLISSMRGIKLCFNVVQEVRVIDYLASEIAFGKFLKVVRQIVKTVLACQAQGINVNNLMLDESFLFMDYKSERVRLLYWPVTSITEDTDLVAFFIRLGRRYRGSKQDQRYRLEYMSFFNSRAEFDVQFFDRWLSQMQKKWKEEQLRRGKKRGTAAEERVATPIMFDEQNEEPYLLRVSNNTRIVLKKFPFVIGREKELCDYVLEQNSYISRQHVIFIQREGRVFLRDNGSRNGTVLNGEKVVPNQVIPLQSGCIIELGRESFYFFAAGSGR